MSPNRYTVYGGFSLGVALFVIAFFLAKSGGYALIQLALVAGGALVLAEAVLKWNQEQSRLRLNALQLPSKLQPVEVSARIEIAASPPEVLHSALRALQSLPNVQDHSVIVTSEETVRARTKSSWYSLFGERIVVTVESTNHQTSILSASSVPRAATVTYDAGINFQNVALLMRALNRRYTLKMIDANFDWSDVLLVDETLPRAPSAPS